MSVGTYDVVNDFGIEIYPNPTGSVLNVVFKQNELYQLQITAIDGKIIEAKRLMAIPPLM
ncbi:MAG: T9SS type A sorting domain-containing protein [Flavobacteriales bacterium]|nr:T9SS type A sorting domain-containing protein [Flavobacteriales bacterium]